MKPVPLDPPIEKLTPFQTEMIALNLIGGNPSADRGFARTRFLRHFLYARRQGAFPCQHFLPARQLFDRPAQVEHRQFRRSNELKLPEIFQQDCQGEDRAGAGHRRDRLRQIHHAGRAAERDQRHQVRSTSSLWRIRSNSFIRRKRPRSISARWATDFDTFATGLRAALRQAPKVILVGEMRDRRNGGDCA